MRLFGSLGRRPSWLLGLSGLASLFLVVSGCGMLGGGGAAEPAGPPANFTRASTKLVTFAYPKSWEKLPQGSYPEGWVATFGTGSGGQKPAEVAVFTKLPPTSDAELALEGFLTTFQHTHDFKRKKDREIKVPTAANAWRIDYAYRAESSGGGLSRQRVLGTDVAVTSDSGKVAVIRITRYPGAASKKVVDSIVGSIALKPGG